VNSSPSQRVFPLRLASWLPARCASCLRWLSHLVDRLGVPAALLGYLMACSTDEAAYRAFNDTLRLQRTSTSMEGGTGG
jgi:hypothetical protein